MVQHISLSFLGSQWARPPYTVAAIGLPRLDIPSQSGQWPLGVALEQARRVRLDRAIVVYWFYVPNKIKRDAANMVQACKPIIDGIVDAKVLTVNMGVLEIGGVNVCVDSENPRVEIELWEDNRVETAV